MSSSDQEEKNKPSAQLKLDKEYIEQKEEVQNQPNEDMDVADSYGDIDKLDVPDFEKNKGKEAFQKQDFKKAIKHYSKALLAFQFLVKDGKIKTKDQMVRFLEEIEIPCNSNLAICNLKLKEYKQCIHFASKVIEKDPTNIKSLYRRGMAHLYLNEFEDARSDFKEVFAMDPTNKEVQLAFEQLQLRKTKIAEKQKQLSKRMLDNLDYSDKVEEEMKKKQKASKQDNKEGGIITKIYQILRPDFKQIFYNFRVTAFMSLNYFSEKLCKRRIPSQYFNKEK